MAEGDVPSFKPSRRDLLVGGAAVLAAGTAYARMPRRPIMMIGKDQLEHLVPLRVGGWSYETASGLVLPPPDQLARLIYDQQVTRAYTSPDEPPVMLIDCPWCSVRHHITEKWMIGRLIAPTRPNKAAMRPSPPRSRSAEARPM